MTPTLPEIVRKLRELEAKATPGPWTASPPEAANPSVWGGDGFDLLETSADGVADFQNGHDPALIAAMRNALPQLLEAADALLIRLPEVKEAMRRCEELLDALSQPGLVEEGGSA